MRVPEHEVRAGSAEAAPVPRRLADR
jgi:hypothetical protein